MRTVIVPLKQLDWSMPIDGSSEHTSPSPPVCVYMLVRIRQWNVAGIMLIQLSHIKTANGVTIDQDGGKSRWIERVRERVV